MFRHSKGPVNNILIVKLPFPLGREESKAQASSRRHELSLQPPLAKFANSTDEDMDNKAIITLPDTKDLPSYLSSQLINDHIIELQQQGSSAAAEMEVKRLKRDCKRSMQMVQQLKKVYDNLQEFCVNELLGEEPVRGSQGNWLIRLVCTNNSKRDINKNPIANFCTLMTDVQMFNFISNVPAMQSPSVGRNCLGSKTTKLKAHAMVV